MTCQSGRNGCGTENFLTASWESVNASGPSLVCWGGTVAGAVAVAAAAAGAGAGAVGSSASIGVGSYYIHLVHRAENDHEKKSPDLCPGSNMAFGSLCGCLETPVGSGIPVCGSAPGCGTENGILTESET